MNYVKRILYCSSLFFILLMPSHLRPNATQPENSLYLSSEHVEHWIIIHGTFARMLPWYKKGGSGYEALSKALTISKKPFVLHSFLWSSYNNHKARTEAAEDLIELLKTIGSNTYHTIHIVAHSHGGTVALLAAEKITQLTSSDIRIKELFTLGMPVHANWYPKAFDVIDTTYHLFSYGDFIQPVFSMFERTLPKLPHTYNLVVKKNNEALSHETLRSPELLMHLPMLPQLLSKENDYWLHLDTKTQKSPSLTAHIYSKNEAEKDKAIDQAYTRQLLSLYSDSRKRTP